jgi:hypothetical protein
LYNTFSNIQPSTSMCVVFLIVHIKCPHHKWQLSATGCSDIILSWDWLSLRIPVHFRALLNNWRMFMPFMFSF